jgi:hypothetical protein
MGRQAEIGGKGWWHCSLVPLSKRWRDARVCSDQERETDARLGCQQGARRIDGACRRWWRAWRWEGTALACFSVTGEHSPVPALLSMVTGAQGWGGQLGRGNAGVLVAHWG